MNRIRLAALMLVLATLLAAISSAAGEALDFEEASGDFEFSLNAEVAEGSDGVSLADLAGGEVIDLSQADAGEGPSTAAFGEDDFRASDEGSLRPNGGAGSDARFAGYVDRLFLNHSLSVNAPIGYDLTGIEGALYRAVLPLLAEVASGERTLTSLSLPVESLGLEKTKWTYEELRAKTDEAAFAALKKALEAEVGDLFDVLVADCPYELYWYDDRTAETYYNVPGMRTDHSSITLEGSFIFHLPVVGEYAGDQPYTTDAEKCGAASRAAARARDVVKKQAGKSDYEKLDAYRDYICQATDYNDDAAVDTSLPYGNPWQLIWVFDGDPSTKVVCEGYAKAFQYLCDMSDFEGDVRCYTVNGYWGTEPVGPGIGVINHAWNVVAMPNGKCYLADITNCDKGTIGYERQLLLAGAASGSVREGYIVPVSDDQVFYQYSNASLSRFSENLLALSGKRYLDEADEPPVPIDISLCNASIPDQVYTGKAIKPEAAVSYHGRALTASEDYTIAYSDNRNVGVATAKLTGIGAYAGEKSVSFTINPKGTSIKKLTAARRSITVTWKKQARQVTGYQIHYCTNKNFSEGKKVTVRGAAKTSRTLSSMKSKQRYYVRIRTYRIVNGTTYFSAWSKAKSITAM